jgi:Tol biopolymer transport system component/DNA-binding winged helix-turn-helix (wHTH) protein
MPESAAKSNITRFGLFELDLQARELRKSGIRIKLQEQPFQILSLLLERPGEIVTREELQKRLWPGDTFVDFDLSLNSAVKKLRQTLGDDSENPRFIETLYRRGYRFIGQVNGVATALEPVSASPTASQARVSPEPVLPKTRGRRLQALAWAIAALFILAAALVWWPRSSPPPRVVGYTQITHDGLRKETTVTDGERLYFSELDGDHFVVAQVSVTGGETSVLAIPFKNVGPLDIAPDGSALLVGSFEDTSKETPLWSVPLPTGSPHRLSDSSRGATWSSDGSEIAFVNGSDIYVAKSNGSQPRKLATLSGTAWDLRFSPNGRRLRFAALDPRNGSSTLWEVNRDGSGLHPLLPGWNSTPHECCGNWTPDGKYYVFQSLRDGRNNLWALPEQTHWFRAHARPMQLTNGPLNFSFPVPSKDGKRIFTVGSQPRNELVRYDGRSGFASYLRGISATDLAFSLDGQWVAYVSVPEQTLWRSKVDGSERLQLTDSSMWAGLPRWSPDGKQIVFMGRTINTNWRAYLIFSAGGAVRDLIPGTEAGFDPGWSPDGKSVVLTLNEAGTPESFPSGPGIAIVDLQTQKLSLIPGAAQLFSPRWSPNGKYIAAVTDDSQKLVLFDRATQQWTELVNMPIGYPSWSHNGQYLYFDTTLTDDPAFFRVRISDRKLERLGSLKGMQRFWGQFASWTGLAPDDSLLLVRDTSSQEIYALDWQAP